MTQSQIKAQSNLYMALIDLKNDILTIKHQTIKHEQQLHKHDKTISKNYHQLCQKFEEVVKLSTNTFTKVQNQNELILQQNQIHLQLTASNQILVREVKEENSRFAHIFQEQHITVEKLIKANQVTVNKQLTALCKKQQTIIQDQIAEYNTQNLLLQQQKQKIELSLESISNFELRNKNLQKLLLLQKQQLKPYIAEVTNKNKQLVVDLINKKQAQASERYRVAIANIKSIKDEADKVWRSYVDEIGAIVRKASNQFGAVRNQMQSIKNQTGSYKNQSENYRNQQKNFLLSTKQELQKIDQIKKRLQQKISQTQQQAATVRKQQYSQQQTISNLECKQQYQERQRKQMEQKINRVIRTVQDVKIENNKQADDILGEMRNKVCQLEKNVNILESRIDELGKK